LQALEEKYGHNSGLSGLIQQEDAYRVIVATNRLPWVFLNGELLGGCDALKVCFALRSCVCVSRSCVLCVAGVCECRALGGHGHK